MCCQYLRAFSVVVSQKTLSFSARVSFSLSSESCFGKLLDHQSFVLPAEEKSDKAEEKPCEMSKIKFGDVIRLLTNGDLLCSFVRQCSYILTSIGQFTTLALFSMD